jgi:uncharacterized protein (UPF0548 family)
MIILLIIAAWIVVSVVVAGLCVTARVGDVEMPTRVCAPTGAGQARAEQAQPLAWEPAQHLEISVHANAHAGRSAETDVPLLQSDGIAA